MRLLPRRHSSPTDAPLPSQSGAPAAWKTGPAIERAAGPIELAAPSEPFVAGLAGRQKIELALEPLAHEVRLEAPVGIATGIATAVSTRISGPALHFLPRAARKLLHVGSFSPRAEPDSSGLATPRMEDADDGAALGSPAEGPAAESPADSSETRAMPPTGQATARVKESPPRSSALGLPLTRVARALEPSAEQHPPGRSGLRSSKAAQISDAANRSSRTPALREPGDAELPPLEPGQAPRQTESGPSASEPSEPHTAAPPTEQPARRVGLGPPLSERPSWTREPNGPTDAPKLRYPTTELPMPPKSDPRQTSRSTEHDTHFGSEHFEPEQRSASPLRVDRAPGAVEQGPATARRSGRRPLPAGRPLQRWSSWRVPPDPATASRARAASDERPNTGAAATPTHEAERQQQHPDAVASLVAQRPTASLSRPIEPVPTAVRATVEPGLGANLARVPVHRGEESALAARRLRARAFTAGGEVHLPAEHGPLDRQPASGLLAHELVHVAQQRRLGSSLPSEDTPGGGTLERVALAVERWGEGPPQPPVVQAVSAESVEGGSLLASGAGSSSVGAAEPALPVQRAAAEVWPGLGGTDTRDELSDRLYEQIRSRLRGELLIDRERAGLVTDRR
jgi:uncharacterized protein DUF4157